MSNEQSAEHEDKQHGPAEGVAADATATAEAQTDAGETAGASGEGAPIEDPQAEIERLRAALDADGADLAVAHDGDERAQPGQRRERLHPLEE